MLFDDVAAWLSSGGQDFAVPVERDGSLLASFAPIAGREPEAVSRLVAMVWPCPLAVDAYVAAGREVEFPGPDCPSCAGPLVLWSGYLRHVWAAGRRQRIFVPRLRCVLCRVSHALLPAFVLAWRLDVAETVGTVIAEVAAIAFARGAWAGVLIIRVPMAVNTASTAAVHLVSRSRIRNLRVAA
ncbi:MAG: DUF6431 domain-containing protein [Micromonosporaceae bacterium]